MSAVEDTFWPGPFGDSQQWGGFYYLGPVSIPPKVSTVAMVDEQNGTTYYLGWNGTAIIPQTTSPGEYVNIITYNIGMGPFLPYGIQMRMVGGTLTSSRVGLGNLSGTPWIYRIGNVTQQTWPEPTNIPTAPPPTIPGIPSTTPPPTGGGYAAWVANSPNNLPTFLTTIITSGWVPNAAFWNGSAWCQPNGTPLTGIIPA